MVSEPAPCPERFASVGQARTIIVKSHIVAMEDTVTSDGQIACLCLSEPRFRGVLCRDSRDWLAPRIATLGSPLPWEAGGDAHVAGRGAIEFCVFPVYSFIFCGVYAKFMAYL